VRSTHPSIVVSRPQAPDRGALRRAIRELEALVAMGLAEELAARMKEMSHGALQPTAGDAS
jgi:hypothetical protein